MENWIRIGDSWGIGMEFGRKKEEGVEDLKTTKYMATRNGAEFEEKL